MIGQKFGILTVLDEKYNKENKRYYLLCKCECGNEKWIRKDSIKSGKQKSCGCLARGTNFKKINLVGKKFNRLTILKESGKKGSNYTWLCKCDCGNEVVIPGNLLTTGRTKSCGCLAKETASKQSYKAMKVHQEKYIVENTNTAIISREIPMKHNTSGVTGVKWDKDKNKWLAEIEFKKKKYYLGRYEKKEDAIKARKDAEEKLHKEFLRNLEKEDRNGN